jgi:5'-3' exonuclease
MAAKAGHKVVISTGDKDLAQLVTPLVTLINTMSKPPELLDVDGVIAKFGVPPESIPDYLALVGDSADGFPGIPGWGAKSTGAVLAHYGHIESIPAAAADWKVGVRNSGSLAAALVEQMDHALLFRDLATLRVERDLLPSVDDLRWTGPTPAFAALAERIDGDSLVPRAAKAATSLAQ